LFQDYLTGYGRTVMLTNVSAQPVDYDETSHALKYAAIAREIKEISVLPNQGPQPNRLHQKTETQRERERHREAENQKKMAAGSDADIIGRSNSRAAMSVSSAKKLAAKGTATSAAAPRGGMKGLATAPDRQKRMADSSIEELQSGSDNDDSDLLDGDTTMERSSSSSLHEKDQVEELLCQIYDLKQKLVRSEEHAAAIETRIRDEISAETEAQMADMETSHQQQLVEYQSQMESKYERKMALRERLQQQQQQQQPMAAVAADSDVAAELRMTQMELKQAKQMHQWIEEELTQARAALVAAQNSVIALERATVVDKQLLTEERAVKKSQGDRIAVLEHEVMELRIACAAAEASLVIAREEAAAAKATAAASPAHASPAHASSSSPSSSSSSAAAMSLMSPALLAPVSPAALPSVPPTAAAAFWTMPASPVPPTRAAPMAAPSLAMAGDAEPVDTAAAPVAVASGKQGRKGSKSAAAGAKGPMRATRGTRATLDAETEAVVAPAEAVVVDLTIEENHEMDEVVEPIEVLDAPKGGKRTKSAGKTTSSKGNNKAAMPSQVTTVELAQEGTEHEEANGEC
jgi:hypothetical protein